MKKSFQTLLWCISFALIFTITGISQDSKVGGDRSTFTATGEKSNKTFTFDGVNALLWDNFLTQSTTAIVAGEWGGLPVGANQVLDAEDFFVPSAATWTIDQIAATGFYSVLVDAQSWGVAFFADNAGAPGTLIQTVTVPVVAGNPNPAGFLSSPVVLTGGGAGTRYWVSIYGIHPTATTLAQFRWNWYASEDPEILSEPYLRDDAGFFGGTAGWVTYTSLGLPQYNALMFQLFGTATGGCPVGAASNPSPVDGATGISIDTPGDMTWTNGAGTTQVEVFFGPAGSMVSVYSGAPITSFAIPSPLIYHKTYEWSVVCKNDTCSASAETWSFTTEQNPNVLFQDEFPNFSQWTVIGPLGLTNWSSAAGANAGGTTPELRLSWTPSFDGESRIRSIVITAPNSTDLTFTFKWFFDWFDNPSGTIGLAATYDGGATTVPLWSTVDPTGNVGPTEVTVNFTSPAVEAANLQLELYFIGNSFNNDNIYWDDMLLVGVIPVELTSFAAATDNRNVTLNWSTATELNNSGFQIERSSGGEYQSVGFIAGHGTTTDVQNYSFVDQNVVAGNYSYRLKQIDFNGNFEYSNVVEVEVLGVKEFTLGQNYPNPFNPSTTINFSLAVDSKVSLKIFDVLGQEVATLVNGQLAAGSQKVSFNASSLNSGVYFYRIDADGIDGQKFSSVKKMILTK